jgi:phosphate transport system protein
MDVGLERLSNAITDMANLAEESVVKAIQAYASGEGIRDEAYNRANQLSLLASEVEDLAVELLARYQPVATDLRLITSCFEIAYGFSRLGRYAYDIAQIFTLYGDLSDCDKLILEDLSDKVINMIKTSIRSFNSRDADLARSLRNADDEVDRTYLQHMKALAESKSISLKCAVASALVLRYLERIADHACYIGDSVIYITTGGKV